MFVRAVMLGTLLIMVSGCNAFQRDTMELPPPPQGNVIATASSTPADRRDDFAPPVDPNCLDPDTAASSDQC